MAMMCSLLPSSSIPDREVHQYMFSQSYYKYVIANRYLAVQHIVMQRSVWRLHCLDIVGERLMLWRTLCLVCSIEPPYESTLSDWNVPCWQIRGECHTDTNLPLPPISSHCNVCHRTAIEAEKRFKIIL